MHFFVLVSQILMKRFVFNKTLPVVQAIHQGTQRFSIFLFKISINFISRIK